MECCRVCDLRGCPGEASPGDRTSGTRRAGVHRTSGVGTLDEEVGAVAGGRLPGGGPQTAGGRDFRQGNHELADIPFSHSMNVLGAPLCAGHHLREQGTLREQGQVLLSGAHAAVRAGLGADRYKPGTGRQAARWGGGEGLPKQS